MILEKETDFKSRRGTEKGKTMEEGRSVILIIRSLNNMDLQESTVKRVLSIILDTKKKSGEEAAEEVASKLIEIVESSETEEELLKELDLFDR